MVITLNIKLYDIKKEENNDFNKTLFLELWVHYDSLSESKRISIFFKF